MKTQSTAGAGERGPTIVRDPLQIPIVMDIAPALRLGVEDVLQSAASWVLVFAVAASGAFLLASRVPG